MNKFFFDTEFMEKDGEVDILSIGVVKVLGNKVSYFYGVNKDADHSKANAFVRGKVLPNLTKMIGRAAPKVLTKKDLATELEMFLRLPDGGVWKSWAYYADYDWVAFCSLWGDMMGLPKQFPHFCMDLMQYSVHLGVPKEKFPADPENEHHALADAIWNRELYNLLRLVDLTDKSKN